MVRACVVLNHITRGPRRSSWLLSSGESYGSRPRLRVSVRADTGARSEAIVDGNITELGDVCGTPGKSSLFFLTVYYPGIRLPGDRVP